MKHTGSLRHIHMNPTFLYMIRFAKLYYTTKFLMTLVHKRCWMQGNEEIFMDASTCALAFRTLRLNGYDVTSG